jgi:hypothetical protein
LLVHFLAGAGDIGGTVRAAVPGGGRLVDFFSAVPGDVDTVRVPETVPERDPVADGDSEPVREPAAAAERRWLRGVGGRRRG